MTMTTCHPKFTAEQRMIVHAVLDPTSDRGRERATPSPPSIEALYGQVRV